MKLKDALAAKEVQLRSTPHISGEQAQMPLPLDFDPMDTDIPGTSRGVEDPIDTDYGQRGNRRAPPISQLEAELRQRIEEATDNVEKDCMEWERQILHFACITFLTPAALHASYHMPSLPYPLLKLEVQMLQRTLLPECPTNELGGYEQVPIRDSQVMDIEKNQPRWRQIWFTLTKGTNYTM